MTRPPSIRRQRRLLQILRQGLVIADADSLVLRHLQRRGLARALPLYGARSGLRAASCAWQITAAGIAVSIDAPAAAARKRLRNADQQQIDIEDAIAASSLGGGPEAAPLTGSDARAVATARVSAPMAAQSKRALAAAKPEPTHA